MIATAVCAIGAATRTVAGTADPVALSGRCGRLRARPRRARAPDVAVRRRTAWQGGGGVGLRSTASARPSGPPWAGSSPTAGGGAGCSCRWCRSHWPGLSAPCSASPSSGTKMRFDTIGATALTLGSGLLILGVALIPRQGLSVVVAVAVTVAVAVLGFFVRHCPAGAGAVRRCATGGRSPVRPQHARRVRVHIQPGSHAAGGAPLSRRNRPDRVAGRRGAAGDPRLDGDPGPTGRALSGPDRGPPGVAHRGWRC